MEKNGVIAVCSPKGGVGRSFVSCFLATALARKGKRVLLVDLDPRIHTLDLLFGVEDRILFGLSDLLSGKEAEKVLFPLNEEQGLYLCPCGALGALPEEEMLREALFRMISCCAPDLIILDTPSSAAERGYFEKISDLHLILSTTEPTALLGAQRVSAELSSEKEALLLLNGMAVWEPREEGSLRPYEMIDLVGRPLVGIVPAAPPLSRRLEEGRAAAYDEEKERPFDNIASRVLGEHPLLFEGMKDGKKWRRGL
ncbi:MAG: P-loop NTPase [Clostridia bacterium]|nr:P-loop NTPase [Clostridia bacterium]